MSGLTICAKDLDDLPKELIEQLNITTSKNQIEELRFLNCAEKLGGEFNLDSLLIQYWDEYKTVLDRTKTINKIYRMIKKGLFFAHPKLKGIYSVNEYKI